MPVEMADFFAWEYALKALSLYSSSFFYSLPKETMSLSELSISSVKAPSSPLHRILEITDFMIVLPRHFISKVAKGMYARRARE